MKEYKIVRNKPCAKFFYKGRSHTHPVRRTVVLIESKPTYIRGYELREGSRVRELGKAPIKTFTKGRIARISEIDSRRKLRQETSQNELNRTTLERVGFVDLINKGV